MHGVPVNKPVTNPYKACQGATRRKNILLLLTLIGFDWLLLGLIRFGRSEARRLCLRQDAMAAGTFGNPRDTSPGPLFFPVTELQSYIVHFRWFAS